MGDVTKQENSCRLLVEKRANGTADANFRSDLIHARTLAHTLTHTHTQRLSLAAYKYLSSTRLPNDVLCLFNQLMRNFLLWLCAASEFTLRNAHRMKNMIIEYSISP